MNARNAFPGKVGKITPMGLYQKVQLNCGFPLVAYVAKYSLCSLSLKAGMDVMASFEATAIHVIRRKRLPFILDYANPSSPTRTG
jgi:tungstate transport system ATP-binding protein